MMPGRPGQCQSLWLACPTRTLRVLLLALPVTVHRDTVTVCPTALRLAKAVPVPVALSGCRVSGTLTVRRHRDWPRGQPECSKIYSDSDSDSSQTHWQ